MHAHTGMLAVVGMFACLSVAFGDKTTPPMAGTYAVEQQDGIEFGEVPGSTGKDAGEAQPEDGATYTMKAFLPERVRRAVPALVIISPGGTGAESGRLKKNAAWLASHGYAVFTPSYRSEEGPRVAFRDVRMAIRFVRNNCVEFGVDPQRIGVWGCGDGETVAALLGLVDDPFPAAGKDEQSSARSRNTEDTTSARLQTVIVTGKEDPIGGRIAKHVSFDDPPFLLVLASDEGEAGRLPTPECFEKAHVEYVAYRVPSETSCPRLDSLLTVDGDETPVWQLVLGFADEHLKETPLNLAVVLERDILRRIRAQDWMLGTRSIVDLRAVLQLAAHRLGREPTPEEMKVAREHAQELADELVKVASAGGPASRISRVVLAEAISRLSPQWPFTTQVRPATVPPVPRGRLRGSTLE